MTATSLLGNPQVLNVLLSCGRDIADTFYYLPLTCFWQGDAPACSLSDALHTLLPLRLLLGVHTKEEWNRAGL